MYDILFVNGRYPDFEAGELKEGRRNKYKKVLW